jgi:hypothetical protein
MRSQATVLAPAETITVHAMKTTDPIANHLSNARDARHFKGNKTTVRITCIKNALNTVSNTVPAQSSFRTVIRPNAEPITEIDALKAPTLGLSGDVANRSSTQAKRIAPILAGPDQSRDAYPDHLAITNQKAGRDTGKGRG